jgi:hypothetical protein
MNLDIWRLISLYLPFNHLNINKEIGVIYDQSWFKDKLVMKYGDTINKHFILYNSNFIEFDIISYIMTVSLKLLRS